MVEILIWLAVPLAITVLAMVWAAWAGRAHRATSGGRGAGRRDASYARFSAAVQKPVPERARVVAAQHSERPSGIAVRPSERRSR